MTFGVDTTSHGTQHNDASVPNNSITWAHTCGSGANKIVVGNGTGTPSLVGASGVTYNGIALTQLVIQNDSSFMTVDIWRLNNPPTGSAFNVVATISGAADQAAGAVSFNDAALTEGTPTKTFGTGANPSINVASVAGDICVGMFATDLGPDGTTTPNGTQIWEDEDVDGDSDFSMQRVDAVGTSTAVGWTSAAPLAGAWAVAGFSISPLATAGVDRNRWVLQLQRVWDVAIHESGFWNDLDVKGWWKAICPTF